MRTPAWINGWVCLLWASLLVADLVQNPSYFPFKKQNTRKLSGALPMMSSIPTNTVQTLSHLSNGELGTAKPAVSCNMSVVGFNKLMIH